jgi:gamma-glutamyltranspeptidase
LLAPQTQAQNQIADFSIARPVMARHGMVVTQEATASQVGIDILRRGGNAVDAAVAVGFALAVTLPRAGNLGGGGFMLIHLAETSRTVAIDYRETIFQMIPSENSSSALTQPMSKAPPRRTGAPSRSQLRDAAADYAAPVAVTIS